MSLSLLGLDASGDGCSVALQIQGQRFERREHTARAHAQHLLPMVDAVMREAGVGLNSLDALALVHGPGSFTGVRIALSVAQGLAFGAGLPIVCLSSLEVMARQLLAAYPQHVAVPLLDARMKEVYFAAYASGADGGVEPVIAAQVCDYAEFSAQLAALPAQCDYVLGGPGCGIEALQFGDATLYAGELEPHASALLDALAQRSDLSQMMQDAATVEPLYLRNEVTWQKRTRIRSESL